MGKQNHEGYTLEVSEEEFGVIAAAMKALAMEIPGKHVAPTWNRVFEQYRKQKAEREPKSKKSKSKPPNPIKERMSGS